MIGKSTKENHRVNIPNNNINIVETTTECAHVDGIKCMPYDRAMRLRIENDCNIIICLPCKSKINKRIV